MKTPQQLEQENKRLREVLKPFGKYIDDMNAVNINDGPDSDGVAVTLGQLRNAWKVLHSE